MYIVYSLYGRPIYRPYIIGLHPILASHKDLAYYSEYKPVYVYFCQLPSQASRASLLHATFIKPMVHQQLDLPKTIEALHKTVIDDN